MSRPKAVMIIDAVIRKQRLVREHKSLRIEHVTAPQWHWRGWWLDSEGVIQQAVNRDLGLLCDEISERIDPYKRLS